MYVGSFTSAVNLRFLLHALSKVDIHVSLTFGALCGIFLLAGFGQFIIVGTVFGSSRGELTSPGLL